jgi:uncharacterized SAM-binding protein YcdF (DUF218 family)
MSRTLRVIAAGLASFAAILVATVAFSLLAILAGFRGNAAFPADCGLVFGAAISGTSTAGPAIIRRVGEAARLWKEGKVHTLILTGGKGDSWRMSEGAVMRQEAIRDGVDGRDILIEDSARSTKENLANSRILVKKHCQTVVAISDRYHLGRIRLLAKKAGWGSLPTHGVDEPALPEGMMTTPFHAKVRTVLRELAAYAYYAFGADRFLTLDEYDDRVMPATGSGTSGA